MDAICVTSVDRTVYPDEGNRLFKESREMTHIGRYYVRPPTRYLGEYVDVVSDSSCGLE